MKKLEPQNIIDKPPIDFEKLKEYKNKKKVEDKRPSPSLTDPYHRRGMIDPDDFDGIWPDYYFR